MITHRHNFDACAVEKHPKQQKQKQTYVTGRDVNSLGITGYRTGTNPTIASIDLYEGHPLEYPFSDI